MKPAIIQLPVEGVEKEGLTFLDKVDKFILDNSGDKATTIKLVEQKGILSMALDDTGSTLLGVMFFKHDSEDRYSLDITSMDPMNTAQTVGMAMGMLMVETRSIFPNINMNTGRTNLPANLSPGDVEKGIE